MATITRGIREDTKLNNLLSREAMPFSQAFQRPDIFQIFRYQRNKGTTSEVATQEEEVAVEADNKEETNERIKNFFPKSLKFVT